jgi:peptide/nickel transport system permease protein
MTENEKKDYITSARAFGIPQKIIMKHQLLKPSLIPTVSVMALDIASLIGNAFLVELLFNFPGLSRYGVTAMLNKDLPAISAVVLVLGIFYILANIVIDIIVSFLDPRIRSFGGVQNA